MRLLRVHSRLYSATVQDLAANQHLPNALQHSSQDLERLQEEWQRHSRLLRKTVSTLSNAVISAEDPAPGA